MEIKAIKYMLSGFMLVIVAGFTILMAGYTSIVSVGLCLEGIIVFIIGLTTSNDDYEENDDEDLP